MKQNPSLPEGSIDRGKLAPWHAQRRKRSSPFERAGVGGGREREGSGRGDLSRGEAGKLAKIFEIAQQSIEGSRSMAGEKMQGFGVFSKVGLDAPPHLSRPLVCRWIELELAHLPGRGKICEAACQFSSYLGPHHHSLLACFWARQRHAVPRTSAHPTHQHHPGLDAAGPCKLSAGQEVSFLPCLVATS